jgi:hypothetical protein
MGRPNHPAIFLPEIDELCPITNRVFERGSGALSHAEQTANFVREKAWLDDMPNAGERCVQTGHEYEVGAGAHPRAIQSQRFLDELPPELKAQRQAAANALMAIEPAGKA